MSKQFLCLSLMSVLALLTAPYLAWSLNVLVTDFQWMDSQLQMIFSASSLGLFLSRVFGGMFIPVGVGALFSFVYWVFKRKTMPYLVPCVWVLWLFEVIAISLVGS
jgi:hypothetical protein